MKHGAALYAFDWVMLGQRNMHKSRQYPASMINKRRLSNAEPCCSCRSKMLNLFTRMFIKGLNVK